MNSIEIKPIENQKILFDNQIEGFEVWKDGKKYADFPKWSEWWQGTFDHNLDDEIAVLVRRGKDFYLITESYGGRKYIEKLEKPFQIHI